MVLTAQHKYAPSSFAVMDADFVTPDGSIPIDLWPLYLAPGPISQTSTSIDKKYRQLTKDPMYYLDTVPFEVITLWSSNPIFRLNTFLLQVEDQLFMVPKYHFIKSTDFFLSIFDSTNADGDDDAKPVKLEGIEKVDFRALLKLLYPLWAILSQLENN